MSYLYAGHRFGMLGIADGAAIRKARRDAGLTQADLAARAGLGDAAGHVTVCRIENGRCLSHWWTVDQLCRVLSLRFDLVFTPCTRRDYAGQAVAVR